MQEVVGVSTRIRLICAWDKLDLKMKTNLSLGSSLWETPYVGGDTP